MDGRIVNVGYCNKKEAAHIMSPRCETLINNQYIQAKSSNQGE